MINTFIELKRLSELDLFEFETKQDKKIRQLRELKIIRRTLKSLNIDFETITLGEVYLKWLPTWEKKQSFPLNLP